MTDQIISATLVTTTDPWDFYDQQMADLNARTPDEAATLIEEWAKPSPAEIVRDQADFKELFQKFRHTPPAMHPVYQMR